MEKFSSGVARKIEINWMENLSSLRALWLSRFTAIYNVWFAVHTSFREAIRSRQTAAGIVNALQYRRNRYHMYSSIALHPEASHSVINDATSIKYAAIATNLQSKIQIFWCNFVASVSSVPFFKCCDAIYLNILECRVRYKGWSEFHVFRRSSKSAVDEQCFQRSVSF